MDNISESKNNQDAMDQFRNSRIGTALKFNQFWRDYEDNTDEEIILFHINNDGKVDKRILEPNANEFKYECKGDYFIIDDYRVTLIEEYGGEGCGDQYWYVCSVSHKDDPDNILVYYKHYGWYQSYDGGYLEDVCEVTPKEVTKIEWN